MVTDVGLQVVGRALNLSMALLSTILLARLLGAEGFGGWSTVFAIAQIATYVADLGVLQIAVREVSRSPSKEPEILGALISLRTLLSIPVAITCAILTTLVASTDEMRTIGFVASVTPLLTGPLGIAVAFQVRARNFVQVFATSLNNMLWLVVVVVAFQVTITPPWLAVGYVGSTAAAALVQVTMGRRLTHLSFAGATTAWRRLVSEGVPIGLGTLLGMIYGKVDQVLVFEIAGSRAAGLYGGAYRIYEQIQLIPFSVCYTVFPVLSAAARGDSARLQRVSSASSQLLAFIAVPLVCLAAAGGTPLVVLLYGQGFADAGSALLPLAIAFLFRSVNMLATYLLFARDRQKHYVWIAAAALVLNVALNLVLIPAVGFVAAAWVTAATEAFVLVAVVWAAGSFRVLLPPARSVAWLVVAAGAMSALAWAGSATGAPLIPVLTLATGVYVAVCFGSGSLRLGEIVALYRRGAG